MTQFTLEITKMAHGGYALGRDGKGRPIFVPFTMPGEQVIVETTRDKRNYAHAEVVELLEASPARVEPKCPHFGLCSGCHLQHMSYERQLEAKRNIVADQLQRIGGFQDVDVRPVLANPDPYGHQMDLELSPTPEGRLGLWSSFLEETMPIDVCPITHPQLVELMQDIDILLPGLRRLTLRRGDDGALLAAFEVEGGEPPDLEVDFPVSVAIVLPDETAASLIGDPYIVRTVKARDFRVSPGCFFQPNSTMAGRIVNTVLAYADLHKTELVLEGYSGVGMLTAFLAETAAEIVAIEQNPDAVTDATVNLEEFNNVTLYQGDIDEILPSLALPADVMVVNPSSKGLSEKVVNAIRQEPTHRLVYVSSELTMLARDGKQLRKAGYDLVQAQPIDAAPQTFQVETVALWRRRQ